MRNTKNKPCSSLPMSGNSWGCLVSTPAETREAVEMGASWLVASHAGLLSNACTVSVMGLLPIADANGMLLGMAAGLVEAACGTPVLAGILAIDQFRQRDHLLKMMVEAGFAGIQTFPSIGILDGGFRDLLEAAELGRRMELGTLGLARTQNLYASGVAFRRGEAGETAEAGADLILIHLPLAENGGQSEWGPDGAAFLADSIDEVGDRAAIAAFVPDNGKLSALPAGVARQFENVSCARINLQNRGFE